MGCKDDTLMKYTDDFSFIEIEYIITAIHRPKRSIEVPRVFELKNSFFA